MHQMFCRRPAVVPPSVGAISTKCVRTHTHTHTHTHSLMFCSDWGEIPMTAIAGLDGSSMAAIVSDGPNGIVVDYEAVVV